ncbi:hypothetical protein [Methylobacterium bullatum]|uniref:Uncharacterized protein n=1 Tax=Methylobacterium bullatum TaxID=570505 RepID=A0AAV4ZBL8_9HYPH|nr:hypothetical protein [Methylobacterium bullatum]GJD41326.1 hypothetical protein OICFNHDK_3809 [Methylobacterium bullatum]
MFGMFTRRSEDEQKRKREAEDRARLARFNNDSAGIVSSYPWPLGVSGAGGHTTHSAECSPSDSGSSSSDSGSCGGGD